MYIHLIETEVWQFVNLQVWLAVNHTEGSLYKLGAEIAYSIKNFRDNSGHAVTGWSRQDSGSKWTKM
jgi:hypothetical protein